MRPARGQIMNWGPGDVVMCAFVLGALVAGPALAWRSGRSGTFTAATLFAVATGLAPLYASLAIGIVGREGAPADMIFAIPPVIALIGAAVARLAPRGLAVATGVAAAAQAGIGLGAALLGVSDAGAFAIALTLGWLAASVLFQRAAPHPRR